MIRRKDEVIENTRPLWFIVNHIRRKIEVQRKR